MTTEAQKTGKSQNSPADRKPLILDIKGNSLDDGPGIRSVVFFKGCPLSCAWCHNPESKKPGPEISFDPKTCVGCGTCRQICPEGALSPDNPFYVDRKRCSLCFECVEACPSGALSRVGEPMTKEAIMGKILPDKPFFDTSGGGVTLSGGEPTLFMNFTGQLLAGLKQAGIDTLVETCGWFDFDDFMTLVYPWVDTIYYDLKLYDDPAHRHYCGLSNHKIFENFQRLAHRVKKDDKTILPRTPLIPDISATETNLKQIAGFLNQVGIDRAALLSYNPLWHDKTGQIGLADTWAGEPAMTTFLDKKIQEQCRAIFQDHGISLQ
ncbi:MAG: glycyl-radical enzyme activating protein [Desulfosudaceae bacterium]